jgi:hypothetical protein
MTRQQAIDAAKEGKLITHRYFSKEEYVTYKSGRLVDEQGYHLKEDVFWEIRKEPIFDEGWSIYESLKDTP